MKRIQARSAAAAEDRKRREDAFYQITEVGPVTMAELTVALGVAADEFETENLSAVPFRRLVKRLISEGFGA